MTTNRLAILLAILLGGMSLVFLVPKRTGLQPVGVNLALPEYVGVWYGTDLEISDKEIEALGPETDFARKSYTNGRGDQLQVTIVFSGHDMNTSIHRPERCLIAQGWQLMDSRSQAVQVPTLGTLATTRLHDVRMLAPKDGQGKSVPLYHLNYYWFVGHSDQTASHSTRYWIDMKDRLLHGTSQRWAYFTVASIITDGHQKFGRTERETDVLIQDFIKQLVPATHLQTVKLAAN